MTNPAWYARRASRIVTKQLRAWTVNIRRPSLKLASAGIACNLGETRTEELFENNTTIIVRNRDYIINAADWPFDTPPEVDDVITDADGTFAVTDESGDTAWRWSGRDRLAYRVHTVEVKRAN